ncbi:hypothetical protein ASD44_03040 [Mesorhizobium sp. Root554]|uniref:hypothetical protein n=1 Tax=unclassified Mesorhizobium TaxID=325217 RepID=UPI0007144ABA|nr:MULTISPECIES: hypothetical protein [unclassified Mesorhizobium]KQZ13161.1 hypothetical protein ASD27_03045 [Mesorhizobium sp. Root1471]KQZ35675.1 hypothetical protein ASD44_03040 [Mesorhizobium sp. Root554]
MRIAALLVSLADLADQASRRSRFVRRRVLAAISPAEEAAYRCVADAARAFGAPVPANAIVAAGDWMATSSDGDDPDDAMRLALRLRALAAALVLMQAAGRDRFEPGANAARPITARVQARHAPVASTGRRSLRILKPPNPPRCLRFFP